MEITLGMIKELRSDTGAGVMDSKKALEEAQGDHKKAVAILLEKGLASSAKRSGRETREGIVEAYIHIGGRIGAIVELNCETDFVARTPEFKQTARDVAMQVAAMSPRYKNRASIPEGTEPIESEDVLEEQAFIKDPSLQIGDLIKILGAKTGENVRINRFERLAIGED